MHENQASCEQRCLVMKRGHSVFLLIVPESQTTSITRIPPQVFCSSKMKHTNKNQVETEAFQRDVVIGLYEMLKEAFAREFPDYSAHLLPRHNGWQYSPDWPGPRRVTEDVWINSHPRIRRGDRHEIWLILRSVIASTEEVRCEANPRPHAVDTTIAQIEDAIFERAWTHGLIHRANDILVEGIKQARLDLSEAVQEDQQCHRELNELEISYQLSTDRLNAKRRAERKVQLMRLRLHWLLNWHLCDTARCSKAKSKKLRVGPKNFDRLIKPYDVSNALDNIIYVFPRRDPDKNDSANQYEMLGLWYSKTLWQCGATWRDLLAIRKNNRRPSRSAISPPTNTVPRYLTWAEIAVKKTKRI